MLSNKVTVAVLCLGVLFVSACNRSTAHEAAKTTPAPVQLSAQGVDAAEPVTAVNPDGSFYVAWVNHEKTQGDVMLARFDAQGKRLWEPVRVNPQAGNATAWRGDQPSVVSAGKTSVYVVWTARVESNGKKGTDLYLSVSDDLGQTFAAPVKINDDKAPAAHGMHSLAVAEPSGRIYVSWLDERNVHAPQPSTKADGHHMESNRELFIASSTDGGRTFSKNQRVAADACPCCKTAMALAQDGTIYIGWRHVLPGNFRHIAVTSSSDKGATFSKPVIVSDDKWVLQGCPVSGPSMALGEGGVLKVLWYAAGEGNAAGLYFAESKDKGQTFSPRQLLAQEGVRGTPVLAGGNSGNLAIWEMTGGAAAETKFRKLGTDGPAEGRAASVASNAELPAAVSNRDGLFVAYISKEKEKRSVWLVKAN